MDKRLRSHFLSLYRMIVADSEISTKEKIELYNIGKSYYGLTEEEINSVVFSDEVIFYIPETEEEKILYLYDLSLIAYANNVVAEEEKLLLYEYAKKYGVLENQVEELISFLLEKASQHKSHEEILNEFSK